MTEWLRLDGPVVIGQSLTDPGDMGEPRIVTEDGVTMVTVPSFDLWPGGDADRIIAAATVLVESLDRRLEVAEELADDPTKEGLWKAQVTAVGRAEAELRAAIERSEYVRRLRKMLVDHLEGI
jgi:hypothetical protein